MEPLLQLLGQTFSWVLKQTVQASVLIVLVILAQWVFRKRLSPGWRHTLWLLVLLRLLLPVTPPSPWSLFNLSQVTRFQPAADDASRSAAESVAGRPAVGESTSLRSGRWAAAAAPDALPLTERGTEPETEKGSPSLASGREPDPMAVREPWKLARWRSLVGVVWALGILALILRVIWSGRHFNAELAREHTVVNPAVSGVLAEAQQRMGVQRVLPVVQSQAVSSPALMGFIRPWLLLPEGVAGRFSPDELRYIFLHELAHLKRWDILVNWLMTAVLVVHWFNPLVWLAFSRMRADRELACDAHALGRASESDRQPYGRTMIKLLEGYTRPAAVADLVGILEDPNLMKRRIHMIKHDNPTGRWPWLAPVLLGGLGFLALTDAQVTRAGSAPPADQSKPGLQRLYQGPGMTQWWAVSPDGKRACYTDWNTGNYGLLDLADGVRTRLTEKGSWSENQEFGHTGAFSPDSKRLAYVWVLDDGSEELRLVDTTTREGRVLAHRPHPDSIEVYDWSPDGGSVLVLRLQDGASRRTLGMELISIETGQVMHEFELDQPALSRLRMSPDGRCVAFGHHASKEDQEGNISVIDLKSGKVNPLIAHPGEDFPLDWNIAGDRLFFVSNRRGDFDLWGITVREGRTIGEATLQVPSCGKIEGLGFTSDGSLCYAANIELSNVRIMTLSKASGGAWRLSPTDRRLPRAFQAAWSHDGSQLAFFRKDLDRENIELCVRTEEPASERAFDTGLPHPFIYGLNWSLDDRAVRYIYNEVKALGIHELVLARDKPERIDEQRRAISPDGRFIATPGEGGLELLDRQTGESREIAKHVEPVNPLRFAFSPSGKFLAYTTLGSLALPDGSTQWVAEGSTLWVVALSGGEPRRLLRSEERISLPCWQPDEQALFCLVEPPYGQEGAQTLWRVPCDGSEREPVELELNGVEIRSISVHPDGKQIAVGTNEQWTELWAMQGLSSEIP